MQTTQKDIIIFKIIDSLMKYMQGSYAFLNKNFKDFSRTFKDTFPIFQGLHSMQKRASGLSFLVLPQHEQFYPEGLSY